MALEVNCTRCTDQTCNGQEYLVKFDYDHFGRKRGTKTVCESQVFKQGKKFQHIIKEAQYQFKFEAFSMEEMEEAAELFPEVTKPETKVVDDDEGTEDTEDSSGGEHTDSVVQEDGGLPEQHISPA